MQRYTKKSNTKNFCEIFDKNFWYLTSWTFRRLQETKTRLSRSFSTAPFTSCPVPVPLRHARFPSLCVMPGVTGHPAIVRAPLALVFVLAGRENAVQPKNHPPLRPHHLRWLVSAVILGSDFYVSSSSCLIICSRPFVSCPA